MKIAHITTVHPRGDVRIFAKECRSLAEQGWDVHLVVADGLGSETLEGVSVHDIGSRAKSRFVRATMDSVKAVRFALLLEPDVIHIHDPELTLATRLLVPPSVKTVFDIHEDTRRGILVKKYLPKPARRAISMLYAFFEDSIVRSFDGLVVPQEKMKLHFESVNAKTILLENYVDLSLFEAGHASPIRPILFHAGALNRSRGLQNMVDVADLMGDEGDFYLAGRISDPEFDGKLGRIKYLGELPHEQIQEWYKRANIGVILYNNEGQYHMAGAVKSYEYMASSMPVIMPDFGDWIDFARTTGCGVCVDVTDAHAVLKQIRNLCANPGWARELGESGRLYVEQVASWQAIVPRLFSLYESLVPLALKPRRTTSGV